MQDAAETEVPESEFDEHSLDYGQPVNELLEIGDEGLRWGDTFDYFDDFELSAEDIPELLRMAADERLNTAESETPSVWAPIHAIRALAQFGSVEMVEPLLKLRRFPEMRELDRLIDGWSRQLSVDLPSVRSFESKLREFDEEDVVDEPPEPNKPSRMAMPEDVYTADERRRIAKKRNKQRKAVKRAKQRGAQEKLCD